MKLKKSLFLLTALCLALMFASVTAFAYPNDPPALEDEDLWINYAADSYAGGTGTQSDPYLISSAEQLAKLAKDVKDGPEISYIREGSYYRLTQDIDLSAHKWYPIGTMLNNTINKSFAGFFDGNSRTISGMRIENDYEPESMNGLFGRIASLADFTSGGKRSDGFGCGYKRNRP